MRAKVMPEQPANEADERSLYWWCPGCDNPHRVPIEGCGGWRWNGRTDLPTLSPSVKLSTTVDGRPKTLCHCFIRQGQVEFLADSAHELSGRTVDIPDWAA